MRIFFLAASAILFFSSHAMEQQALITDSQEWYDAIYHPRSQEQLHQFLSNKKIAQETGDLRSLEQLAIDSNSPCIRSTRELVTASLRKQNFNRAALWCEYACRQSKFGPVDPAIALTLAGLLDSADELKITTPLASIHPIERQEKIYEYLQCSALARPLPVDAHGNAHFFLLPEAQKQLAAYEKNRYERIQTITDSILNEFSADDLKDFEALHTLPSACFFINKYLQGTASTNKDYNPTLALYHAKSVLDESAAKNYFLNTGVYQLLYSYAHGKKPNKYQLDAALVLADLEDDPVLALEQIKPVIKNLHRMAELDFLLMAQKTMRLLEEAIEGGSLSAVTAMKQFLESPAYARHKKIISARDGVCARDLALQLYGYTQKPALQTEECHPFCTLAKSEAISLLQSAVEKGDPRAHWKLLGLKELTGSDAQLLAQALEKAKTGFHGITQQEVATALENVQKCNDSGVALVLAELFATGLEGYLPQDEPQALKYCKLAGSKGIDILTKHVDAIKNPQICFFAAVHLHSQREMGDSVVKMTDVYLNKARENCHDDISLQKMIIKFSLEQGELFFDHAMRALHDLCKKYIHDTSLWEVERQFANEVLDLLMNNANSGHTRSAVFLSQVLHDCADLIKHPKIDDCKKMAHFYKYHAAMAGDQQSLFELLSDYEDLVGLPVTDEAYGQAAQYWNKVYSVSQKMSDENEKQKWEQMALSKTRALVKFQREFVMKEILLDEDPAFYYHCMLTLHKTDLEMAMECLSKAESFMVKDTYDRNLIDVMGVNACIDQNILLKKGWAYYAKAIIKMCRSRISIDANLNRHIHNIEQLKEIHNLILQARHAPEPYENDEILEESKIEHLLGTEYLSVSKLASLSTDLGKDSLETALAYFEKAAKKNCAASAFAWANICLTHKRAQKGQEVFEKAIDYLFQSARNKFRQAVNRLDDLYQNGFEFTPVCGGAMTTQLYQKIKQELSPEQKEFPGISRAYELLLDTPRALKLFQNQEYEKAYELFKKQAEKDDVEALVYMGIMHRDGLHVERSVDTANEFFIRALTIWDGSEKSSLILHNADKAIDNLVDHDLTARMARALYIAGLVMPLSNPKKAEFTIVSDQLCLAEQMALKSKVPADHTKLFDSGLTRRINAIISDTHPPLEFMIDLVSCYAKRISKLGLPSQESHMVQLLNPMLILSDILTEVANSTKPVAIFHTVSDEKMRTLIHTIESAIKAAPQSTSPSLSYLLGLIHVAGGIEKRAFASIKNGMNYIKHASENQVAHATHTLALLQLYGNRLSKEITLDKKNALLALEGLVHRGNIDAMVTLSKYHFADNTDNKKNAKKAAQLLEQVLRKDPKNNEANFLCAEIYCNYPSLINNNFQRIYDLFECVSGNSQEGHSARLYQIYLSLKHDKSLINPSQVTQRLLDMMEQATLFQDDVTCLINALTSKRKFDEDLIQWFTDNFSNPTTVAEKNEASRAAAAIGWWHMVNSKIKAIMKESWHKDYAIALEYLQKSVDYAPDTVLARALLAALYQEKCYDRMDLDKSRSEILLACSALGKKNQTLKDARILHKVMQEFRKVNSIIHSDDVKRDFSKIISFEDFEKMHKNLELINKLEEKYS
jgi:TPR repeat protein